MTLFYKIFLIMACSFVMGLFCQAGPQSIGELAGTYNGCGGFREDSIRIDKSGNFVLEGGPHMHYHYVDRIKDFTRAGFTVTYAEKNSPATNHRYYFKQGSQSIFEKVSGLPEGEYCKAR